MHGLGRWIRQVLLLLCAAAIPAAAPAAAQRDARYRSAAERLVGAALGSNHAWLRLSQLCDGIGPRLSGSANYERAVAWAAAAMREDRLDAVRLQAVTIPRWVRGRESAEMIAPRTAELGMLGLGGSVGTPPEGIVADVVAVRSFAELDALPAARVRGRIVLYDVPFTDYGETVEYRWAGARRAAKCGAVAALVRSVTPVSLHTPHTGVMGAYADSLPGIPAAAVTIEDATMMHRLLDRGERVRVRLRMEAHTLPDTVSHNVIGEVRGRERPDEIVLVGGHLDSWDVGQGAHDNGGGCVVSMEALRLVKRLGLRPRRTVRCVLFANEENGTRGGKAYADSLHGDGRRHFAAIEADDGVEPPVGFSVGVYVAGTDSTDTLRTDPVLARLRGVMSLIPGLGTDGVTVGDGGTDIGPLMKLGVPGIGLRTTGQHYFDWHHTNADTMDKVDPAALRRNVAALAVLVYVLAEMPEPLLPAAR
jgi:carboxypeptidase Q